MHIIYIYINGHLCISACCIYQNLPIVLIWSQHELSCPSLTDPPGHPLATCAHAGRPTPRLAGTGSRNCALNGDLSDEISWSRPEARQLNGLKMFKRGNKRTKSLILGRKPRWPRHNIQRVFAIPTPVAPHDAVFALQPGPQMGMTPVIFLSSSRMFTHVSSCNHSANQFAMS